MQLKAKKLHICIGYASLTTFFWLQADQDKATKDHQIRNLNDEIAHQDELINKLNKEKKVQGESVQKTSEELQVNNQYPVLTILILYTF